MKKIMLNLTAGIFFLMLFLAVKPNTVEEEGIKDFKRPATVIVYTVNGNQYYTIVYELIDCSTVSVGNVDSIDDCFHTVAP